jgi:hypothetical protein
MRFGLRGLDDHCKHEKVSVRDKVQKQGTGANFQLDLCGDFKKRTKAKHSAKSNWQKRVWETHHCRDLLVRIFVGQSRVFILEGCQMLLNKLVVYAQFSGLLV